MNDDLISRQAAIDALDFEIVHMTAYCDGKNEGNPLAQYNKGLEDGKKAIEALPTVQPERKKGEWIEISSINHTYKCSECGRLLVNITDGRNNVSKHYPYCHCGAKMKGVRTRATLKQA